MKLLFVVFFGWVYYPAKWLLFGGPRSVQHRRTNRHLRRIARRLT